MPHRATPVKRSALHKLLLPLHHSPVAERTLILRARCLPKKKGGDTLPA